METMEELNNEKLIIWANMNNFVFNRSQTLLLASNKSNLIQKNLLVLMAAKYLPNYALKSARVIWKTG